MGQEVEVSTENVEDMDNPDDEGDEDFNDDEDDEDYEDDDGENAEEDQEWLAQQEETAVQVFLERDFSSETSSVVDLGLDLKRDKILIRSVPFQLAIMKSVEPTIASTRSRRNVERPNYAADEEEVEELGNLYQARLPHTFSPYTYPKCQARQILIALLNYFRAGQKEEEGKGS